MRLGIAGIGMIAKDYIGILAAGRVEGVTLCALCSRNQTTMEAVITTHGLEGVQCFTDYTQMLQSGAIDAVLITTPHGQHPKMALEAVEAGIHPLVEKPVGIDSAEVHAVLDALKKHPNLVAGVMYNRRMSKAFRKVKELMDGGIVGDLVRVTWLITNLYRTDAYYGTSPWRGTWQSEGGGLLMTQASHQLDLLQWICGVPTAVMARHATVDRPIHVENEAEIFMTFPNGAHGQFIASAHETPGTNRLEICGTRGQITVEEDSVVTICAMDVNEPDFARSCPSPFEKPPYTTTVLTFDDADNKIQQGAMMENFGSSIEGKTPVACTLQEGLHSLELIQGAYYSQWTGREVALPISPIKFAEELGRH